MRSAEVVDLAAYRVVRELRAAPPPPPPPRDAHDLAHRRAAWDRVALELAPIGVSAESVLGPRP